MKKYQPKVIEEKWQQRWLDAQIYASDLSRPNKYYVLAEFAYPSGDLHVGHWFTFCGADIYARYKRMKGFNVFFPNGFDSFGLPAEGAAIKRNIHPKDWTESNIEKMKSQYQTMGPSFDFYKNLASHKPSFYKWNQWIFLKMYEKGIAYKGKCLSNWCPVDQTVLANEAVESGKCWRCGSEVIQKEIEQWFFRITGYADGLIWPENPAVDWPKSVRDSQNEWIGKSEGAKVLFSLKDSSEMIEVFTTRVDTIFGATFLVLAPEHPLTDKILNESIKISASDLKAVKNYVEQAKRKSELERKENKEKTGVFIGVNAINPLNNTSIPVWIADYVLPGYGTGAIMAVPAHDERDFEFAQKFKQEIIPVIKSINKDALPYTGDGVLINSGDYNGLSVKEAQNDISKYLVTNKKGSKETIYHIHDWSISRQRYWGTPIPIINCPQCGSVPVPEKDLPVELPYEVDYQPKGKPPLASNEGWLNVKCPKCDCEAKRDPETMDTFVDSSWYFFRYLDPDLKTMPFDIEVARTVMPVDIYFGGAEHTLGHTLYSRFFTKFFKDLGLTGLDEYANKRVNHGIVLGPDGQKMSKSRGNVINPDDEVQKYGGDAVRIHVAFFMPYDGVGPWISDRIWGPYRFLERVWNLFDKVEQTAVLSDNDKISLNRTIKKVSEDIEEVKFNTAIAALMEWLNELSKKDKVSKEEYQTMLLLLSPFAPHLTEEIWEMWGNKFSIHLADWPKIDDQFLESGELLIVIQVNGKVRDNIKISKTLSEEQVIEKAKNSEKINKYLTGTQVKKTIYIPGKILNFVI